MTMKTPDELARDYCDPILSDEYAKAIGREDWIGTKCVWVGEGHEMYKAFLAGYQAAAPQWISVEDRLPEIGNRRSKDVLILDEYGEMSVEPFEIINNEIVVEWGEAGARPLSDFTHWMPLPEPPKEEGWT